MLPSRPSPPLHFWCHSYSSSPQIHSNSRQIAEGQWDLYVRTLQQGVCACVFVCVYVYVRACVCLCVGGWVGVSGVGVFTCLCCSACVFSVCVGA